MTEQNETPKSQQITAYKRMQERIRNALQHTRQETLPTLQHVVENAQEKAVELGELTREEAERIGEYLRRDVRDAANYLEQNGSELRTWLKFDLELVEDRILDMFAVMVDHTRLELDRLAEQANRAEWHTGEIVGPGTLRCKSCGQELQFHEPGHIPPCPKCRGGVFIRAPEPVEPTSGRDDTW